MDLSTIQQINDLFYYKNIKEHTNDNKLKKEINKINNNISETLTEDTATSNVNTSNVNTNVESYYSKSWNKLLNVHKSIKLKEYIFNLNISINKKKELLKLLKKQLKNKTLNSKNIEYDITKGKLVHIKKLII
jgi:hypothetical protein